MIDKARIIITGGRGMIAGRIPYGIKLDKQDLDIAKIDSVQSAFDRYNPQLLIHLAAIKDKTYCQNHPLEAYNINVTGVLNIAMECQYRNIPIIFVSSSYVFDGKSRNPYKEDDSPNPLSVYGRTKLIGELIIKDLVKKYAIIRLGLVYGDGIKDSFVDKIIKQVLSGAAIKEYADNNFSLTNIENFIKGISFILDKNLGGIFHLTEKGGPSYYEVADYIREQLNPATAVQAVKSGADDNYIIPRGGFEVLEPSAIFSSYNWQELLRDYLFSFKR